VFDANGALTDAATEKQLRGYLEGFTAYVAARSG
jgi:hypothetical protein